MRLSTIIENKIYLDSPLYGGKKVWVLDDPNPIAVIGALQRARYALGGWISKDGVVIWNRDDAEHAYIARMLKIDRKKSIAFYINQEEKVDGNLVDVSFDVSDFSGINATLEQLMEYPLIASIIDIMARRKEELLGQSQDQPEDFSGLFDSMRGSDY